MVEHSMVPWGCTLRTDSDCTTSTGECGSGVSIRSPGIELIITMPTACWVLNRAPIFGLDAGEESRGPPQGPDPHRAHTILQVDDIPTSDSVPVDSSRTDPGAACLGPARDANRSEARTRHAKVSTEEPSSSPTESVGNPPVSVLLPVSFQVVPAGSLVIRPERPWRSARNLRGTSVFCGS